MMIYPFVSLSTRPWPACGWVRRRLGQLLAHLVITSLERTAPFRQDMLVPAELVVRSVIAPQLVRSSM